MSIALQSPQRWLAIGTDDAGTVYELRSLLRYDKQRDFTVLRADKYSRALTKMEKRDYNYTSHRVIVFVNTLSLSKALNSGAPYAAPRTTYSTWLLVLSMMNIMSRATETTLKKKVFLEQIMNRKRGILFWLETTACRIV
jgi:hypothetical protein